MAIKKDSKEVLPYSYLVGDCPETLTIEDYIFIIDLFYFWMSWVFTAAQGFSLVATSGGYSLAAVLRLPTLCLLLWGAGSRALRLQQLQHMWRRGSVAPRRVQSSWTRDQTYVSHIGRRILYHWVNRGALEEYILNSGMIILSPCSLLSTLPHQDGLHLMTCPTAQESLLLETSRAVQWLRLHASNPKDPSLLPGWGTKIPHAIWQGQKRKKKIPPSARFSRA